MAKIGDTLGNNLQQLRKNNHLTQKPVSYTHLQLSCLFLLYHFGMTI